MDGPIDKIKMYEDINRKVNRGYSFSYFFLLNFHLLDTATSSASYSLVEPALHPLLRHIIYVGLN